MTTAPGFTAGEPPAWDVERFLHGDATDTALITLERNRRTFAWKCADVDSAGLTLRLEPSTMTLGGLLQPLAWVEEDYFQVRLAVAHRGRHPRGAAGPVDRDGAPSPGSRSARRSPTAGSTMPSGAGRACAGCSPT